ncbi:helix-turn-helix domain-containing protein [Meiothermus cerbereus]|uniref:helix-turn-helix domain-containing protein n=1 Tax=Meiothermus cerbereus TaxID=65552 RepID=UPI003EE9EE4A
MEKRISFSLKEVATMTGLSVSGLRKMHRRGELEAKRFGRKLLVPRAELERLGLLPKENPAEQGGER